MVFGISRSTLIAFSIGSIGTLAVQAIYQKYLETFWGNWKADSSEQFGKEDKDSSVQTDNAMTDNSTQTVKKIVNASIQAGVAFSETKQSGVQCGQSFKDVRQVGTQTSSNESVTAVNADEVGLVNHGRVAIRCDERMDFKKCVREPAKLCC